MATSLTQSEIVEALDRRDFARVRAELVGAYPSDVAELIEPLAALILVNTFVSLFAGFMPVPGGVGVAEAGFTAGLMAIGVPDAAATSTAIAFRLVTFYLPPLWGAGAMRWLRRHDYL